MSEKKLEYMKQRNASEYRKEQASVGLPVKSQAQINAGKIADYRTTVRIRPTKAQVWQVLEYCRKMGRDPAGRSFQWAFQLIIDSLIISRIQDGTLKPISEEAAIAKLREFKSGAPVGEEYISVDNLDALRQAEEDTTLPDNVNALDFIRSEQAADQDDFGDLFPYPSGGRVDDDEEEE